MRDFTHRVAVVTGAGSGIGQALAVALAEQGCDLALVDIEPAGMAETADRVRAVGRRASTHEADVSNRTRMAQLPDEVEAAMGRVDILVNNAGVSVGGTFEEQSIEDIEWIVGINFWGVVYGTKFFLPRLRRSDDGYIVNLSSVFGLVGVPQQSTYCATKFAVRGLSESLAAELAGTSIRVMSVHPGGIRTNIVARARYVGGGVRSRQRVLDFFERHAMLPERAAAQIVAGMRRDAERVVITREAIATDIVKRFFPVIPSRVLSWVEQRLMHEGS